VKTLQVGYYLKIHGGKGTSKRGTQGNSSGNGWGEKSVRQPRPVWKRGTCPKKDNETLLRDETTEGQ